MAGYIIAKRPIGTPRLIAFGAVNQSPPTPLEPTVIARVRHDGYATAVDELEVGLTGMAAPVLGAGGRAIAALSISGPTLRLGSRQIEDLYPTMIDEAQARGPEVA